MIKKIELQGEYSVIVENDSKKQSTILRVDGWQLSFTKKQDVLEYESTGILGI